MTSSSNPDFVRLSSSGSIVVTVMSSRNLDVTGVKCLRLPPYGNDSTLSSHYAPSPATISMITFIASFPLLPARAIVFPLPHTHHHF